MLRILVVFIISLGLANAAMAQIVGPAPVLCNRVTTGVAAATIATATSGHPIVICGWNIESTTAGGAWVLGYGTGAACVTSNVPIAAYSALAAGTAIIDHLPHVFFTIPTLLGVQQNLCVISDTTVNYIVYWAQY